MHTRSKLAVLASAVMVSGWLVASAAPAGATSTAMAGPCGSGYNRVGVYAIPKSGPRTGTLEVYYNSGTGKNCALAYGYGSTAGKKTYKSVTIGVSSGTQADHDYGQFAQYAGPVYTSARNKCINVSGWIGKTHRDLTKVHCG
ncbi:hypothetical protein ABT294_44590 [Nonomuraea sp. NPDC000554]|uniref:hypothetical protein n=1 Tax=Nonomuraea sp. NPDC000554 TaxID=3154259 RepID=UPI003328A5C8